MFRKYSSKKSNLSNYSITYAGNYHIKIYNTFFKQVLKLKPIVEKEGDPLRCIYEKDAGKYINLSYTPSSNFDMDDEFIEQYFASLQQ
jgi:heterodisulfide reductase subunit B